jgi:Ca-activated chloride channel homolog
VRAAVLGALVALTVAAPAAAQTGETPVVGGGSFNAAPILEPGSYSDTVLPAEYIYYAIRVQPGQRLHLTGHTDLTDTELLHLAVPAVYLTIQSPTRVNVSPFGEGTDQADIGGRAGADFEGPAAQVADDVQTEGPWSGSGVYFLSVQAVWRGSDPEPPRVEIPFHFTVSLEGTPQAKPTQTATPTPTRTATPTAAATPAGDQGDDKGPVTAAGAGVAGLLIGVVAGIALTRRRR